MRKSGVISSLLMALMVVSGLRGASAEEPVAKPEPERFSGFIAAINTGPAGVVRFRLTIERWSTPEERNKFLGIVKSGGSDALATAMEDVTVGYIQMDQNLRYPVSYAIKVKTDKGELIRVATNRPIAIAENQNMTRSRDYPIGVLEFRLPPTGPGEGTILLATQVQFNAEGQLEVRSLPQNTGPQKLNQVEREVPKPKKEKKK